MFDARPRILDKLALEELPAGTPVVVSKDTLSLTGTFVRKRGYGSDVEYLIAVQKSNQISGDTVVVSPIYVYPREPAFEKPIMVTFEGQQNMCFAIGDLYYLYDYFNNVGMEPYCLVSEAESVRGVSGMDF